MVRPSVQAAMALAGNIPEVGSITPMRGAVLLRSIARAMCQLATMSSIPFQVR